MRENPLQPSLPTTVVADSAEFETVIESCINGITGAKCAPRGPHRWIAFTDWQLETPASGTVSVSVFNVRPPSLSLGSFTSGWRFVRRNGKWAATFTGDVRLVDYKNGRP